MCIVTPGLFVLSEGAFALNKRPPPQEIPVPTTREKLSVKRAIEKAMASNREQISAKYQLKWSELDWQSNWMKFFVPTVTMKFSVAPTPYTLGQSDPGPPNNISQLGRDKYSHGYPTTTLGINVGQYTIFNKWQDWITLEIARLGWESAQAAFVNTTKTRRIAVAEAFFKVQLTQEKLDSARRSLLIAQALVEYTKSKIANGKAQESEYQSSLSDLANAKNEVITIEQEFSKIQRDFALSLGDPMETQYEFLGSINFAPLKLTVDEAYAMYLDSSQEVKDARRDLKQQELNLESVLKARLPLPTIAINGIDLSYKNAYYAPTRELRFGGSGANWDLTFGTIEFSLPLYSSDGFFEAYKVEKARVNFENADYSYTTKMIAAKNELVSMVEGIKAKEQSIENLKKKLDSDRAVLNGLVAQLGKKGFNRLEGRDAIRTLTESESSYQTVQVEYLRSKLDLCNKLGVQNLPGDHLDEYFENIQ